MADTKMSTRRVRLARILLSDSFRIHTVEYREEADNKIGGFQTVKRSIEVLEIRDATVLIEVLGGPAKSKIELPYDRFVRINEVRV